MEVTYKYRTLLFILGATFLVYCFAHWQGICSLYVINDDVRQQIYWMQAWQDPGLFQGHYLTEYARQYVPWGVQVIYWLASHYINPVQFSKILTAILFIATAGLLFILAAGLVDELTGILAVCIFYHFGFFLGAISGGLSRSFVFPLLILYLIFLSRGKTRSAGLVLMVQALFNPYLFVLCLLTHGLFLARNHIFRQEAAAPLPTFGRITQMHGIGNPGFLLSQYFPPVLGMILLFAKYKIFQDSRFGSMVSNAEMIGHIEYTVAGRYEMIPVPSLFFECIRPFIQDLPLGLPSIAAAAAGLGIFVIVIIFGWNGQDMITEIRKLKIFAYLIIASAGLYVSARIFLLKLFIPSRYLEYSLTVFYCLLAAVLLRSAVDAIRPGKYRVILIVLLILLGACRLKGVAIHDYSGQQAALYQFFQSTSRDANIAGHPYLMDNILTFSQRKVLVSYELSHPWYGKYWSIIKPMTYDFFNAYYSENPNEIRGFCRKYAINYFVVRESDFVKKSVLEPPAYFEPFGRHIGRLLGENTSFAVLDEKEFKPVFHDGNIRVLTPLD